jgi:phage terminase large subunit GpA-like protein
VTDLQLTSRELLALRPPARKRLSEWVEDHRVIPAGKSSAPGPWRNARAPHLVGVMDALTDPQVERVTLMCPAQVGKSEVAINLVLYSLVEDPGDVLVVMAREDDARDFSQERLWPSIEASPAAAALFEGRPKADRKRLSLSTGAMRVAFAWAGSPAGLASKPIRYLVADEVDKYAQLLKGEADPLSLAIERTHTYRDRKIVQCSTPTTRDGLIYREWLASDRRELHVPCPHCGQYQQLVMARLEYPERPDGTSRREHADRLVEQGGAVYACEHCDERIDGRFRRQMIARGVWVPEGARARPDGTIEGGPETPPRHRGFHLTRLVSPWTTWDELAAEWVLAQESLGKLRNFKNSWLGEIWEDRSAATAEDRIRQLEAEHPKRHVPLQAPVLTMGVDVQAARIYYAVRAWGVNEESWLVDAGMVEHWEQLQEVLDMTWPVWVPSGKPPQDDRDRAVRLCCIDSGHRTAEVYSWCREHRLRARPIKGKDTLGGPLFRQGVIDRSSRGKPLPGGLKLWLLATHELKDKLHQLMHVPDDVDGGWWVHRGVHEDYARQVTAEHKVRQTDSRGRVKETWQPKYGGIANHWWDCEVYALAAAEMLGVWRMKPEAGAPTAAPARATAAPKSGRGVGVRKRERGW